ncbi:UNVERIFIED_ORG: hypothetical protein LHK14_17855 [Roseateles sp. XES5]|nr:hypothetical protein [Roseateles sp. XES5]
MNVADHIHLPVKLATNRSDEIVNSFGVTVARCKSIDAVVPIIIAANAHDEVLATLRVNLRLLEEELKNRQVSGVPEYIAPVETAVDRTKKAIALAEGWT